MCPRVKAKMTERGRTLCATFRKQSSDGVGQKDATRRMAMICADQARLTLQYPQTPRYWVSCALSPGVNWKCDEVDNNPHLLTWLKER